METVTFTVVGLPMPKGSLTRMPNGAMLPAGTRDTRERVAAWRYDIQQAATMAMGGRAPFRNALRLAMDMALPVPKTTIRKRQVGWWPHVRKPDIDKLLRSVLDHLTGVVWIDDAQVVSCIVNKSYAWDGQPGADVTVSELSESQLRSIAEARRTLVTMIRSIEDFR